MKQFAKMKDDFEAVRIATNGEFESVKLIKGQSLQLISNDCGPVVVTMDNIIIPKEKCFTERRWNGE